jgi:hypothetical protein
VSPPRGMRGSVNSEGVLELHHDAGFFSTCSVALLEIARSALPVVDIDASNSFRLYSDEGTTPQWSHYFAPVVPVLPRDYGDWSKYLLQHRRYRFLNVKAVAPILAAYFRPSHDVVSIMCRLMDTYEIALDKTVVVHYRGTDKGREVHQRDFPRWLSAIDNTLKRVPSTHRLLIQTDQLQVQEQLLARYKDRAFFFAELPATDSSEGFHFQVDPSNRREYGQTFLAATYLMSQSATVITHTGNGALWTALYRGHVDGFTQVYAPVVK